MSNEISYVNIDKSEWGPGEWQDEPDKVQWTDPATGMPCLVCRGHSGALCGYVGVDKTHPLHGKHYDDACDYEVHGGVTYSDKCQDSPDPGKGVCHIPEAGKPDDVWWFGFDCAHWSDLLPAYQRRVLAWGEGTYKNLAYVREQVTLLAAQLVGAT